MEIDSEANTAEPPARLTYLVFDTSGSTQRDGWIDECNRALPQVIEGLEVEAALGTKQLLSVCTYADSSQVRVPLENVRVLTRLPALAPSGFSSLSSAMSLLNDVIAADLGQLTADGVSFGAPTVVFVADGLPTDRIESVDMSRQTLRTIDPMAPCLHVVHGEEWDYFAFKGIGFSRVSWVGGGEDRQIVPTILECLRCAPECIKPI